MNPPIVRLFVLVTVLFAVLVAFTSRWTVFEAEALRDNSLNKRALLQAEKIKRGRIVAADGTVLARSVRQRGDRYRRRYPTGPLFAHAIGYFFTNLDRVGLERSYDDDLTGRDNELATVLDSILGKRDIGKDVVTYLEPDAQRVAVEQMAGRDGAVVALDVDTGGVLAMAAEPAFEPNDRDEPGRTKQGTEFNRATQSDLAPGSTMKVVTAAAAIDTGQYEPSTQVSGENGKEISGAPLNNFGGRDYGQIDLTAALTNSVNTVWAEVGEELGGDTMTDYMEKFGFFSDPELDYPDGQMTPSGVRLAGARRTFKPSSNRVDVGRVAIGQGGLAATPLQMAMVAQTVANGGVRMEPRFVKEIIDPDGRREEVEPERAERVISGETAAELTDMMKNVVREGSGTAAALEGVELAGKTGTAEVDIDAGINNTWFIGFTDEFAVAVVLERQQGQGGVLAAPIAKAVLEALGA